MKREKLKPAVEQLFSARFIRRILVSVPDKYRERILSIEVVMLALLNFVISELESFLQLVDRLKTGDIQGLRAVEVSPSAFYKRLRVIPHTVFLDLLRHVTKFLHQTRKYKRDWILTLAPFANCVYAIDDTTLDALMRRTKALKKFAKGAMETLGGRLGCALDLTTGAFAEILYDSDRQSKREKPYPATY